MNAKVSSWMIIGASVALGGCLDMSGGVVGSGGQGASGAGGQGAGAQGLGANGTGGLGSDMGGDTAGGANSQGGQGGSGGTSTSNGGAGSGSGGGSAGPANAYFPPASWFYQDISSAPLAADSATVAQWLADHGGWGTGQMRIDFSLEVLAADASTPFVTFDTSADFYSPDCDHVPIPLPAGGALEGESAYACAGDGDCHLIVRSDGDGRLYEMWRANLVNGTLSGGCLAAWDMTRVYGADGRGLQCTSADAAGFPIAPLLISPDEVAAGEIAHAIRFILPNARMRAGAFVAPGTHAGAPSGPAAAPVYGSRWRLRADYDVDALPSEGAKVVARAMQKYGMALADGGNIALTAQSDRFTQAKWAGVLDAYDLSGLQPTDFEIIDTGATIGLTNDCNRSSY